MSILFFLRHLAARIVLPPLLIALYAWLGYWLFIYMLGCAFGGAIGRWSFILLVFGVGGGFVLSAVPSLLWPGSRFLWPFPYAVVTLVFGLGSVGSVTSAEGPWAFIVWSACGFAILSAGFYGSAQGKRVASRLQPGPNP